MSKDELEARIKELDETFNKLREQGLMVQGAKLEVQRQLAALADEGTPAVEPVDFKSAQRRGS